MSIKARVKITDVVGNEYAQQITMVPVYDDDKSSPNYSFSQATPNGKFEMTVTNKDAWPFFVPGKILDVTFETYEDKTNA